MSRAIRDRAHWYDIDGLVTVESRILLPELEFFRTSSIANPDLVISVRHRVGGRRVSATDGDTRHVPTYTYREIIGSLTANLDVEMGSPVRVVAAPLLALSPHVLYTNIVEPLLRFLLASRGRMLLHAGCIALEGRGVLLSARTDTGKTATILRLLRESGGAFLSDDMTIMDSNGTGSRYPKPLTISAHTIQAASESRLRARQRLALAVQGRLHSKSGRSVGKWLARDHVPIMALNSFVQAVIPPPKYRINQLVPCQVGDSVAIEKLFLIERGWPALISSVKVADAVEQLIANTADAYEFPPFRVMAPELAIAGIDFSRVQEVERGVLFSALRDVEIVRLRVADFSWPKLVRASLAEAPPEEVALEEELAELAFEAGS